jgi:hypothetical protein
VNLERFGKNDLQEEEFSLMTMVLISALFELELSSFESHSCPI